MKRIKVRFHLGRGINYRHWRIQYPNGDVQFVHPTQFQIHLIGCQVKNSKKTSQRIFEGMKKLCVRGYCVMRFVLFLTRFMVKRIAIDLHTIQK